MKQLALSVCLAVLAAMIAVIPTAQAIAPRSCGATTVRADAGQASGDAVDIGLSVHQSDMSCAVPSTPGASRPRATPSTAATPITKSCAPDTPGSATRAVCEAVAAADIAACDPELGYTGQLITYPNIDVPTYRPAAYPSASITCNTAPEAPPIVVSEADFRSLPLTPSTITVGPPQGWVPVNMITVVYTDAQPQTLTTTLLGQPVTVRATPTQYTWDWTDGSTPTVTTDPGAPWPAHTLTHTYARTGTYTVAMTTTWTGEYSLDAGATYTPITGTATTTSTAPALTVRELRTHLVEDLIG